MRSLFLIILFSATHLFSITLKDKFSHATPGDYIITEQAKNYSILFVRAITENSLILEEISAPTKAVALEKTTWQEWISARAPGHTSWISYEIDFKDNILKESYSYTQNSWLYVDDSDYILAKLLTLSLDPVQPATRRRIGPAPPPGEPDTRAVWTPSLVIGGKKISKPKTEVWHGKWPNDGTLLAGCGIELYFDGERPLFPFPFWMEVQSPHYAFKVRTIDSGSGLNSPMPLLPRHPSISLKKP